ncbi:fibronectin type III domain-containing protein [archaeon]|nr:fibronectin type III domain-containing protein [archaeon]
MKQTSSLVVAFAIFGILFSVLPSTYAQTSDVEASEQTTLSDELLNDPLAQEILQKIEESKRKIAKLEQQNYDNLQAQKFLEDRRAVALDRLNQALIQWEEKWHEFSPKVAYQKFIDKMPSGVQGIYAKQFEFTEKKHELGVSAKINALDNGMTSPQALQKFNSAARSTVNELSNYNEKIQPHYAESLKKKISERIVYWDDMVNGHDERIEKDKSIIDRDYSIRLSSLTQNERVDIREIIQLYNVETMTRTDLSHELGDIREKYNSIRERMQNEKAEALSELESKYDNWLPDTMENLMSSRHPIDANIAIVWNSDVERYDVVSTTTVFSTPDRPVITGLVSSPTEIKFFWQSPASIDKALVTGYRIEVKEDDQSYVVLAEDTGTRNTSYTHTDLINDKFYTYRVSAITDVGVGDSSNEIRASTATTTSDVGKQLRNLTER